MGADTSTLIDQNKKMRKALELGQGMGVNANVLLWNSGIILKEFANKENLPHLHTYGDELIKKAQEEYAALHST
jgi:hypothetical protein